MAGYIGTKAVNLSTTGADIAGDADVSGALDVGGGLTVDNDGSTVLTVDRATSDGTIIDLQKSGSSVGNFQSRSGVVSTIVLNPAGTDGAGLTGGTDTVTPTNGLGTITDGELDLGFDNGKFRDLYLSGGVYLGGTGAANKLDDYEEGTWTPVYRGGTTAGTATVGSTEGFYTKIGNSVTIWLRIANMTISGAAGATLITGLPFTSSHGSAAYASVAMAMTHNIDFATDRNQSLYVVGTSLNGLESINGTTWADWAVTNSSGIYINITMTYRTS
jgi:hypothetical protein